MGESEEQFTIQSISKAFVYGLALADRGREAVMRKVGVEPTGEASTRLSLTSKTIVLTTPW
jgi:glutaminase